MLTVFIDGHPMTPANLQDGRDWARYKHGVLLRGTKILADWRGPTPTGLEHLPTPIPWLSNQHFTGERA